jgi:hypothetical protein
MCAIVNGIFLLQFTDTYLSELCCFCCETGNENPLDNRHNVMRVILFIFRIFQALRSK